MEGLIGKKIGMTQIFNEEGNVVPVTVIELGPCTVVQRKTPERDGYSAIQLGFDEFRKKDKSKMPKPIQGHFKKANLKPFRNLKEFRVEDAGRFSDGQVIDVALFSEGERVDVTANSKGRGFAGVIKRHGFAGAPQTRGTHEYRRHPGSIGQHTWPARVYPGKKLPGRMGNEKVKTLNLEVVKVLKEKNLLLLKGAVPGPNRALVTVTKSKRAKNRKGKG
jgi:large subunit ribosomal protein L3